MKIIECKDLTKEYISSDSTVKAVDNVSISFEQGEFCAVTGPSGSGKSTFLHILSSLENATSGYVIYGEKKAQRLQRQSAFNFEKKNDSAFVFSLQSCKRADRI